MQRDYSGKKVFIGIDVHKKTYSCACICDGEVVKRDRMPSGGEKLLAYMRKFFPEAEIQSAYEAGFSGFHLHRFLVSHGIDNWVVHPASIEISARDRVKTDKRDSLKIAVQLAAGRLKGIYVPSQEQEARRSVTRLRCQLKKLRHQVGMQFKALLLTQGLIQAEDDSRICQKWIDQKMSLLKSLECSADLLFTAQEYVENWENLTARLELVKKQLAQQAAQEKSLHDIYESVPGIGLIHARELANELGDMRQFRNEKQLFSFTGLTPSEHSSGEHVRQGHISRQGRSILRKILVESAWVAVTKDPSLRIIFDRISQKGGAKRAIVGIARRLVGRIRACLLRGVLYTIQDISQEASSQNDCVTSSLALCV